MNPGIAQQFVRFNSLAHHILKRLHDEGPATGAELARKRTHAEAVQVSSTLIRLRRADMVFIVGRHRPTGKRSHPLYGLQPVIRQTGPRVMTRAEKQAGYRERLKVRVPSVFEWRGSIPL